MEHLCTLKTQLVKLLDADASAPKPLQNTLNHV